MQDQHCNVGVDCKTPEATHTSVASRCLTVPIAQLPQGPRVVGSRHHHRRQDAISVPSAQLMQRIGDAPMLPDSSLSDATHNASRFFPPRYTFASFRDRFSTRLLPRASADDSFLPIDNGACHMRAKDEYDDDMPLLTPGEGYTVSAATNCFFSRCEDEMSQETSYCFYDHFYGNQPLPMLDIDDDDYASSDDDEESSPRTATPKLLKIRSTHTTLRHLQPFAALM